jgi:hypothetical protein
MREIRSSGSVGEQEGNDLLYPEMIYLVLVPLYLKEF